MKTTANNVHVVTGPTSGIGYRAALELAQCGSVILVGRDRGKLEGVRQDIAEKGGVAYCVVHDLSDLAGARRAADEIAAIPGTIAGVLNNAGVMLNRDAKTADRLDLTFATNYLGPFALTQALVPHLPDGANVLFVASATEDPERKPAKVMGMRGGRFISVEASARGEWQPGGSKMPGIDAYATSKQCCLASVYALARETPRLKFDAVEPGINPGTGLGGAGPALQFIFGQIVTRLPPFARYRNTPQRAAAVIGNLLTDRSLGSGLYFDEKGRPMRGSTLAEDPVFQERVIAETRAFLTGIVG